MVVATYKRHGSITDSPGFDELTVSHDKDTYFCILPAQL
jgi:hypothetical protein